LKVVNFDSTGNGTVLGIVPCNSIAYFSPISWENRSGIKNILNADHINNIDIQIYDENDNFIQFNNINWSITLKLSYYKYRTLDTSTLQQHLEVPE
jgi:hypothetical protein